MHELKELVDNRLEKSPMCSQETWILTNHIHDVGGYNGFIIFPTLLLTETQQVLNGDSIIYRIFLCKVITESGKNIFQIKKKKKKPGCISFTKRSIVNCLDLYT